MIGTTIGHYKIESKVGEGGMGVVYKATDMKLDRLVALKFLPEELSRSASDSARFTQEARAAAALNHGNICTIHGIEDLDGKNFIVMEYVDGQTLGEKKGSVSLKQAIDIATQIADGLAAAHEKGITHRDIKPDNIMIRKDGSVQIMDFGLAKLRGVSNLTQQGSTVGTARYMSPEQVQGEDIDHRSDIFSLGVLLYELFAGQLPFRGVHETALMYEIVHVDPEPMSTVKSEVPPELDAIVLECLAKEKTDRYQSAAEIAKELRRFKRESSRHMASRVTRARSIPAMPSGSPTLPAPDTRTQVRSLAPWIFSVLLVITTILGFWQPWRDAPASPAVVRFSIHSDPDTPIDVLLHPQLDISQDGSSIVYRAGNSLYLRRISSLDAIELQGIRDGRMPVFSPDGRSVAYFEGEADLMKVSLDGGGLPVRIAELGASIGGGARRANLWTPWNTIVFSYAIGGLHEISTSGGEVRPLTTPDSAAGERTHRWPDLLPDGETFIYTVGSWDSPDFYEDAVIQAYNRRTGETKVLLEGASSAKYAPTGHLLFTRSGVLYGIRFDPDAVETVGQPIQLISGVAGDITSGAMQYDLSDDGTLVYAPGDAGASARQVVKVTMGGTVEHYPLPAQQYFFPEISPDGSRIALCIGSTRQMDIYVYNSREQNLVRFTFGGYNRSPIWSPDGKKIVFSRQAGSDTTEIVIRNADGTGSEQVVFTRSGDITDVSDWSPDGRTLLLNVGDSPTQQEGLVLLDLDDLANPRPFLVSRSLEFHGRFSPDMKYILYASNKTGAVHSFVQATSSEGGFWQVSQTLNYGPRWSASGKYIYVNNFETRTIMRFPVLPGAGFRVGEPEMIAPSYRTVSLDPYFFPFDVFPDESGFVTTQPVGGGSREEIIVVLNWFEELKRAFAE